MALYGLGSFIAGPLAGWLSDRVTPLRVIQVSLLGSGALMVALPSAHNYIVILIVSFFWALIGEAYRPASSALVSDLVMPYQRRAAFAIYRLAANIGMSIGPVLGGLLVTYNAPYAALFWIDGITAILAGMVWFIAAGSLRPNAKAATVEGAPSVRPSTFAESSRAVIRDRAMVYFMFAYLPVAIVFFQFEGALPLYMVHDLHLSEFSYGSMFLINTLLIISSRCH